MSIDIKVRSLTPAIAGWWAKFTDNGDSKTAWYSPIAAWALCDVKYDKQHEVSQEILPVLTGEAGMTPHHNEEGYCDLLYLPDDKFVFTDEPYAYAWYLVEEGQH